MRHLFRRVFFGVSHTPNVENDIQPIDEISIEHLWSILNNVHEWIRFADTKAVAIVVGNGTFVTIVATAFSQISNLVMSNPIYQVLSLVVAFSTIASTMYALACLLPRLTWKTNANDLTSLIYYGSIAGTFASPIEYHQKVSSDFSKTELIRTQLTSQIWVNSKVAMKKYKQVALATWLLFFTVCCILTIVGSAVTHLALLSLFRF